MTNSTNSASWNLNAHQLGCHINDQWLWRGLDFEIQSGERIALTGPSGSGKSLLMRRLCLLDPLQEGELFYKNQPLAQWSVPLYRTQVRYVAQKPMLWEGTVEDNFRRVYQYGQYKNQKYPADMIHKWLNLLGRPESFLTQKAHRLSGGESQLVALLRALQNDPELLLLDEPTSAMDPPLRHKVEQFLTDWQQERQTLRSWLWITHDEAQISRISNRQITLSPAGANS
ncbi:MAG: ATP-binding cassette domain-containing protein [SAR324 cluster bacterium]|nr:ATP-binding cassette domain-containing protein [SAR324 cluster bacterium]